MPKLLPIQQSFSQGEISPELLARTDLPGYDQAALELTNMIPTAQGPARSRQGWQFIAKAEAPSEQYCRMLSFYHTYTESYAVIITVSKVYIADRSGLQPSVNFVTNGEFTDGGVGWTTYTTGGGSAVLFALGVVRLTSGGVAQTAGIQQTITLPVGDENKEANLRVNAIQAGVIRIRLGTAQGTWDIVDEDLSGTTGLYNFTVPGVNTLYFEAEVIDGEEKILDAVSLWTVTPGQEEYIVFDSPWNTVEAIELIQFDMQPGGDRMIIVSPETPTQYLDYFGNGSWDFGPYTVTGQLELDMSEGNRPATVAFYKGRLYFGGTRTNQVTIYASKPGDYLDFTPGDGSQADDALVLPLDQAGSIVWMRKGKALMIGLDTGEHIIYGGSTNAVVAPTPQNVDTEQQSSYGSAQVQAVAIGEQIGFVTGDRLRVYLSTYARDSLGWISTDVTFPSEHIAAPRLRNIELVRSPDQILFFPRFDGKLASMSYDARRNQTGWAQHETNGTIVSATAIPRFGSYELWVAVLREGELYFERSADNAPMDSHKIESSPIPTNVFGGFEHLEGRTVQVLLDGSVHPDVVVGENGNPGEIVLDNEGLVCIAGLGFTARLRTVPVEVETTSGANTSDKKSWNKIFVRLVNCARPYINGRLPPTRNATTPMGDPEPEKTEDVEVSNLGWDLYASIIIEQPLPLDMNISGTFGEMQSERI